eukprot:TRINITY_DN17298_c0_g1_i1.p1 TRINITY_DN17298_c0_g1~~TRINITY_DN17298_c0_g1_i1.p1  ORF type:complete len:208 (-),score=33.83 TRINITY_DN17298_c0_g1_i1:327-950(-)
MDELEVKTINPICVKSDIRDKIKQTEATQQGNTCSDTTAQQLVKGVENKSERNVPILMQTVSESKNENIHENRITSQEVRKNGKDTTEESFRQINSSISTESLVSKDSSEETQKDNNQIPKDEESGESSAKNENENVNYKNATSTKTFNERKISIEQNNLNFSTHGVNSTVIHRDMEASSHIANNGTEKKSTCSSESSEATAVENKK